MSGKDVANAGDLAFPDQHADFAQHQNADHVHDIDIGADLQHRRTTVATRQRDQIVLWRQHRCHDRAPREALDAEHPEHALREGRRVVVMQIELAHDALPAAACSPCTSAAVVEVCP